MMTEEQVTKAILTSLIECGWVIIAYDFPQSGSGKMLRPNDNISEKNKGGLIPDVVAVKNGVCLFFENKDRVVISDFQKVSSLIHDNQYTDDISTLLAGHSVIKMFYGVGFPFDKWNKSADANISLVDFIIGVTADKKTEFLHNPYKIMF